MSAIAVRPGLYYCDIDGAYVFLDLDAQRYFLLGSAAAGRFQCFLDGVMADDDLDWLIGNRLLCQPESAPPIDRNHMVAEAAVSTMDEALPRADAILTLQIILAHRAAKRWLRRSPLKALLQDLRAGRDSAATAWGQTGGQKEPSLGLSRITAAFRASERISNSIDQCLPRGIALYTLLQRQGFTPNLVIGVTIPFTAHCWVQVGDRVVSDSLDRVRPFTPILAL